MRRSPAQAAYWQQLQAADLRRDRRRLPVQWLHAAFMYAPRPRSVGPRKLAHRWWKR